MIPALPFANRLSKPNGNPDEKFMRSVGFSGIDLYHSLADQVAASHRADMSRQTIFGHL
ncbi:hypothetical protein IE4803_CH00823 [Rhizobium etli bv. phaseoli str. IE4803]|nr:hypothetical protein IE4803_CH00823 [Rhizobium etli bv. phaseoli str. IE4803]